MDVYSDLTAIQMYNSLSNLVFVPLKQYNSSMGTDKVLNSDSDVLVYSNRKPLDSDKISVLGKTYNVVETLPDFMPNINAVTNILSSHFIVVRDESVMQEINEAQQKILGKYASFTQYTYMTDLTRNGKPLSYDDTVALEDRLNGIAVPDGSGEFGEFTGHTEFRSITAKSYGKDFAGLFFLGIFLGVLFVMATVLIMYYKQITEGFDDKKRFAIMQNVGMSHSEVRAAINGQILTVFFLPLIMAALHVAFAFPFIYRILTLMGLFNMKIFGVCTLGCFIAFAIFYIIVYYLTARLYYAIVKK